MSERLWNILLDSFWKIFLPGLKVTIPLTVISFSIALVIATAMAMVQFANIKGLRQIARFYIWIFRGTPLLVQLFVVFYGLPRAGILIDPFPAAVLVFSLNEAPTVPRRCVRPWKPFRQASSKPATVSACRICRSCGELSFRRRCAPRSRRFPTL